MASVVKNLPASAGDLRDADLILIPGSGLILIPGSGRFSGEGNGNPLQYSCLENAMERGAWLAMVHRVGHD